jgi:rhodanese-related sulfurtransferase
MFAGTAWLLVAACAALPLSGCGGGGGGGGGPDPGPAPGEVIGTTPTPGADIQAIAARVHAVLALGYNTTNADALAKLLLDANPANDPFLVDTREPADFARGHIPGAVNLPLQTLPRRILDGTAGIPSDRDVVVASYWGNDGNMGSFVINCARVLDPATPAAYKKSTSIFGGMTAWSFDRLIVPANTRFEDAQDAGIVVERACETTAHPGVDQGAYPAYQPFGTADVVQQVLLRAEDFLNSVPTQFALQVYPSDIVAMVDAGTAQIVSVRGTADYAKGHIPGAVNIPYQKVADLANQTKFVEFDRTAYVYCYTGHTGSLSTIALGILGYPARNILWGMNGWTLSTAVASGQLANYDLLRGWDFPLDDGGPDDLGALSAFVPSAGCTGCHTDLTSIFYDREIANVPPAPPTAPSEGEG